MLTACFFQITEGRIGSPCGFCVSCTTQHRSRPDGLTPEEGTVMDHLTAAMNAFTKLISQHPSDLEEFVDGIHRCQHQLAIRIARRHYPAGWPVKSHD